MEKIEVGKNTTLGVGLPGIAVLKVKDTVRSEMVSIDHCEMVLIDHEMAGRIVFWLTQWLEEEYLDSSKAK